ncbi:olfactomedin-like protein 2B [Limanda limanda]|uniref:olfactomedin-like protein 2B n=1 Tax=Limanda limanda TaxID=27771 RepID=UPI0029C65830|nr:olfactomedin-like protein 2B [Limanda limanda]
MVKLSSLIDNQSRPLQDTITASSATQVSQVAPSFSSKITQPALLPCCSESAAGDMWHRLSLLLLCCALTGLDALEADRIDKMPPTDDPVAGQKAVQDAAPSAAANAEPGPREEQQRPAGRDAPAAGAEGRVERPTAEPLEDELDNQENIISQLLGDYDKVKTVSSGSDCVCRCIVRPIKRSDCSRILDSDPTSLSQDFYTVETVTKGTDCKKCVCMVPPSAVNPCEGEYRFKKLQEASKDDIKLATIMDLLEGSMYGMDLLKLNSVTTKLLTKMDNMEKAFARNFTERAREKERAMDRAKEKEKEKKAQQKKKKVTDLSHAGQKNRAPASPCKQKNNDEPLKKNRQQDVLDQQEPTSNKTASQKPVKEKNSKVVKAMTFYKAEEESYKTTAHTSWDLLISDQLPPDRTLPIQDPGPAPTVSTGPDGEEASRRVSSPAPTQPPTDPPTTPQQTTTTAKPAPTTIQATIAVTTSTAPNPTTTTTKLTTTSQQTTTTTTTQATTPLTQHRNSASSSNVSPPVDASPTAGSEQEPKRRLSWTESPKDQPKTTKKPGMCKDTVASLSDPVQHNSYGLSDGAWMRDARGHGNVIYLTSGLYGNNLQEFRDMDTFKSGQASNSYKLPYSFTGTGHVVFNGAFYYNRAFSRDVIRYDLRHRYVAAWNTLHDAILEEQAHRTQTEVEFAVDESGLWLLYPALDTEGFHQEVILLTQLHPRDLQPIRSFRTGLRRGRYGNSFLVCGVLYGVNSMEHRYANVTYAFDTHTLTHTVPSLAFTNMHAHTSQLAYCPLDKKLYAWDDGHQMMYDVIFAY